MQWIKTFGLSFVVALWAHGSFANNDRLNQINGAYGTTGGMLEEEMKKAKGTMSAMGWMAAWLDEVEAFADKVIKQIDTVTDHEVAGVAYFFLAQAERSIEALLNSPDTPKELKGRLLEVLSKVLLAKDMAEAKGKELMEAQKKASENFTMKPPEPSPIVQHFLNKM